MENMTNGPVREETEETLNFRELFTLCLAKWYWFLLSTVLLCAAAVVYILHTPATYSRSAEILIKENSKGAGLGDVEETFADMGMFKTNTNVNNEVISLQSPALMYEVVRRLHLNMDYQTDGRFHRETVYGASLPVSVSLPDLQENTPFSFTLAISPEGKWESYDFETAAEGRRKKLDYRVDGKLGDTLSSPAGRLIVNATAHSAGVETPTVLYVRRGTMLGTVESYRRRLAVSREQKDASIIRLELEDQSVRRADDVLNMLIAVYNENWIRDKNQIAISTSMFINDRLKVIEGELGSVDDNISSFKSEHLIPDISAVSQMYLTQSSQQSAEIMTLNNQLYMARYIRNYLGDLSNRNQLLPVNSGLEARNIEAQIVAYNEKLLERNGLAANSSDRNPIVVDMDLSLQAMRSAILVSVDNEIEAIDTHIRTLQDEESKTTSRIAANPKQSKFLISVERQQKVKESLYLFLLQKREENELSQAFTAYNTRVITPPGGTGRPVAPNSRLIFLLGLILGIALPAGLIVFRELSDTKVRSRADIESLTIPFIGEIPLNGGGRRWGRRKASKREIVVKPGNRNLINEAFRVLRTNLEFMADREPGSNVMMVTSYHEDSGKSFLSMNIAAGLAIKGKKALVIDGDMRHAAVSAYVHSPSTGLADYLGRRTDRYEDCILTDENLEGLHILPVGTIPPNPTELLYDERFAAMLSELRRKYDYILIDCPPVDVVADTRIIEALADRTLWVIRAGLFERGDLRELQRLYDEGTYKNMAVILNGTENLTLKGKYGGRYGYRYGYRERYGSYRSYYVDQKSGKEGK